jgi:hypothetical protein
MQNKANLARKCSTFPGKGASQNKKYKIAETDGQYPGTKGRNTRGAHEVSDEFKDCTLGAVVAVIVALGVVVDSVNECIDGLFKQQR